MIVNVPTTRGLGALRALSHIEDSKVWEEEDSLIAQTKAFRRCCGLNPVQVLGRLAVICCMRAQCADPDDYLTIVEKGVKTIRRTLHFLIYPGTSSEVVSDLTHRV